jgi:phosphatidylinositol-3-phosphatase
MSISPLDLRVDVFYDTTIQPQNKVNEVAMYRFWKVVLLTALFLSACIPPASPIPPTVTVVPSLPPTSTPLPTDTATPMPTPTQIPLVPNFKHIVIIPFENKEFDTVIDSQNMPYFNVLAQTNTLLTQYYAVTHPSLPNYIAMVSGDAQGITSDCTDCFVNATSLADLIEQSGRTWKNYQQSMPKPCYVGDTATYVQKHNPFIYFDPIRLDTLRCEQSVVPLDQLDVDLNSGSLPDFLFISPNLCYSAHDCALELADAWLKTILGRLVPALDATGEPYLIVLTWDEGQTNHSCCGIPSEEGGGRIATILISPQAKSNFQDDTPYTQYSLLKTISAAWGLPYLGHAADDSAALITRPWK